MIRIFPLIIITLLLIVSLPTTAVDVVLTLDRSLSMKGTDPDRDSIKGAELFGQLLSDHDRLALTSFAQNSKCLLPLTPIADENMPQKFTEHTQQLQMSGIRTNFESALRVGYQIFQDQPADPNDDKVLILFSDGQLNLGTEEANHTAQATIFDELIPKFQADHIRVLGVAFSPESDLEFLTKIAEATGGQAFRAEKPTDIYDAFVRLFEQTDQPLIAPIVNNGVQVDENVKELNVLVKRNAGDGAVQLTTPTGQQIDVTTKRPNVAWKSSSYFDQVSIQQPEAGIWKVNADNEHKKAYINSELDLRVTLPTLARFSDTVVVAAQLLYQGTPINPEIVKNTRFMAVVFDAGGTKMQELELTTNATELATYDYRGILKFEHPGPFEVQVTATHPDFQRQKNRFITLVKQIHPNLTQPAAQDATAARSTNESSQPISDEAARKSAIFILIISNLALLAVIGIGVGIWWWRRSKIAKTESEDFDLDD
ncbi:hypothetical protein CKO12_03030 [Chromatium okenii]|uniref:vWA domain-containing protein n=1 Tax=Chromatium okenii TaxID=61644 RepID=UPI001908FEC9|nr:vWA domain-containing protein [Chromatium okenii]MBK1640867.1 hypothetical protein [Chromatium okenii]